ncbi:hypothetical protein Tco_0019045 [Tanacetum coccineum]
MVRADKCRGTMMGEQTIEEYMAHIHDDTGTGVVRLAFGDAVRFELKGQFLKELRENTFIGTDNEDANKHIDKVLDIVDLFYVPFVTDDQLMLRVFPMTLIGLDIPTKQMLDSQWPITKMNAENAKTAIQDMVDHSKIWHTGASNRRSGGGNSEGLVATTAQLSSLGREIKRLSQQMHAVQVGYEHCHEPYLSKDCPNKEQVKTAEEV